MTDEVCIDGGAIRNIDATLQSLAALPGEVRLRFANHWPDESENSALLAAALIGSLRDRDYLVDVVDETAAHGLLRTPVASALWRRPTDRTRFTSLAAPLARPGLGAMWTSGSRSANDALFASGAGQNLGAFGPTHATFVNPHLSSGVDGHPDVVFLVRRWLTRRLEQHDQIVAPKGMVEKIGVVLTELVANVQEHSAGSSSPRPECLVRLVVDQATIRCSVLDTGVGLDESLRQKVLGGLSPSERIGRLLKGEIPGWDAGRGIGLPRVRNDVASLGGRLVIFTKRLRVIALPEAEPDVAIAEFDVEGTVVDFSIPARSLLPD